VQLFACQSERGFARNKKQQSEENTQAGTQYNIPEHFVGIKQHGSGHTRTQEKKMHIRNKPKAEGYFTHQYNHTKSKNGKAQEVFSARLQ
jgi:hypothetical protein